MSQPLRVSDQTAKRVERGFDGRGDSDLEVRKLVDEIFDRSGDRMGFAASRRSDQDEIFAAHRGEDGLLLLLIGKDTGEKARIEGAWRYFGDVIAGEKLCDVGFANLRISIGIDASRQVRVI